MDTAELWTALDEQRAGLADLLDDLSPAEWETPSLCPAWRVQDVAAHLTLAHTPALTAVSDLARARGNFDRMIRDTALRRSAAVPREELAQRVRGMVGSRRTVIGLSVLEPLLDAMVHGQDMTRPLGRPRPVPPAPAAETATRVWRRAFPFRARQRLAGFRFAATDTDWAEGTGDLVEGPIGAILLLLTGRTAAVGELTGPGAARLQAEPASGAAGLT